jgi:RNA polymerase subunit RPABC4/transcription elongation factor Spt4
MRHHFVGEKCTFCGVSLAVSGYSEECPAQPSIPLAHRPDMNSFETGKGRLTNCPDCGGIVSRNAQSCPHCGAPVSDAARKSVLMEQFFKDTGQAHKPRCPICGMPNLTRLSLMDRITTTGFVGTAGKTMKCSSCGALC